MINFFSEDATFPIKVNQQDFEKSLRLVKETPNISTSGTKVGRRLGCRGGS